MASYQEMDGSGSESDYGSVPKYEELEAVANSDAGAGVHGGQPKPKILLMGPRRSGKSSIQKVVFHKMSPNETLFLESTNKIMKDDISNSRGFLPSLLVLFLPFFPDFVQSQTFTAPLAALPIAENQGE